MADVYASVRRITNIKPLANSDNLSVGVVDGWQVITQRDQFKDGELVVYFQTDLVVPKEIADELNITKYLREKTDKNGNKVLVVGKVKLRGEPSFGVTLKAKQGMRFGDVVDNIYQTEKFEPPVRVFSKGSAAPSRRMTDFVKYTDIDNMRNRTDVFNDGEPVIAVEKIHGTNSRIGIVPNPDPMKWYQKLWNKISRRDTRILVAGSKNIRRAAPESMKNLTAKALASDARHITDTSELYWIPLGLPNVRTMLYDLSKEYKSVLIFGELFGGPIQDYSYGRKGIDYAVFDICCDGKYMDFAEMEEWCEQYGVTMAPVVEHFFFSLEKAKELSNGPSLIHCAVPQDHGREGIVVRPLTERTHPKIGRVILKYVGDDYLFRGKEETTDE